MLTGPHTDFPEVMILVAFLLGACTEQRPQRLRASIVTPLALLLGVYASTIREQGVFTWDETERSAERWLSNRARIRVACKNEPGDLVAYAVTDLRSMYVPQKGALQVRVGHGSGLEQNLLFERAREIQRVKIACPQTERHLTLTVVTQPAWSPYRAWPGSSGDRRLLGVEQLVLRQ